MKEFRQCTEMNLKDTDIRDDQNTGRKCFKVTEKK